jgi:hypothetical protein
MSRRAAALSNTGYSQLAVLHTPPAFFAKPQAKGNAIPARPLSFLLQGLGKSSSARH